jgi:hypothetical protein
MKHERWYAWLLRLYPREFRDRFSHSMVQTFRDMDRERRDAGQSAPSFLAWVFFETTTGAIKENAAMLVLSQRHLIHTAIATACLLMVPLVLTLSNPNARIYGGEGGGFDWMPGSFLVMGAMLFSCGLAIQYASVRFKGVLPRIAVIAGVACAFLLIWSELAVDAVSKTFAMLG